LHVELDVGTLSLLSSLDFVLLLSWLSLRLLFLFFFLISSTFRLSITFFFRFFLFGRRGSGLLNWDLFLDSPLLS